MMGRKGVRGKLKGGEGTEGGKGRVNTWVFGNAG